jgi:PII-like signaling protein
MLPPGPALKLTIYLNQDTGAARGFLADDIIRFLQRNGIRGATVFHAFAGFGAHHQLHTSGAGDVAGLHLPIVVQFIEKREKVSEVLPELLAMVTDGLVEAQPTEILKNVSSAAKVIS